jgi:hypothetical protein
MLKGGNTLLPYPGLELPEEARKKTGLLAGSAERSYFDGPCSSSFPKPSKVGEALASHSSNLPPVPRPIPFPVLLILPEIAKQELGQERRRRMDRRTSRPRLRLSRNTRA